MIKQLEKQIGQLFINTHKFHQGEIVELLEIKRSKVKLKYPDRKDSFTIPLDKFNKFYILHIQDL